MGGRWVGGHPSATEKKKKTFIDIYTSLHTTERLSFQNESQSELKKQKKSKPVCEAFHQLSLRLYNYVWPNMKHEWQ